MSDDVACKVRSSTDVIDADLGVPGERLGNGASAITTTQGRMHARASKFKARHRIHTE